ncbi:hypothetical protein TWF970_003029 [Orbilia oligospora]|uniref:RING-type domain-containing protein n=1 Tax=Orbilia oligospora TaxID=2813651 RepID=A0A7C8VP41_ORBOL|nr:hypothetical protein TWF970_003029 [Orbilia oligospora]
MWCNSPITVLFLAVFPLLAIAELPEIPEGANFAYHIEGDAIIRDRLVPKTIDGWGKHPGTRYPEPCFPLMNTETRRIYTFGHVTKLALNAAFYDIPNRDDDIKFEFFQDDECRIPNHPRMLYINGEYEIPEEIKTRMGSLILIDPLSLTFTRNPYPYSFWRVNASENVLVKSKENWDRDRRLFGEVTTDLSAGNQERSCTICLNSLVEKEPSTVLLGDCGHSYHGPCLDRWAAAHPERNPRDPVEFKRRTGFPLAQLTPCPTCRKPLNRRKMARIPTQVAEEEERKEEEPRGIRDPRDNIRDEPILRGTPERRRNDPMNVNIYNDYSSTIGPPSLFTTPGSDLEDLVNAEYMDEKARGASRVKRPANYDFQSSFVGNNPLVLPEDYTSEVLEAPFNIQGPEVQLTENPETNDSPFVPNPLDEGISGFNGIGRSLRSGQLG